MPRKRFTVTFNEGGSRSVVTPPVEEPEKAIEDKKIPDKKKDMKGKE